MQADAIGEGDVYVATPNNRAYLQRRFYVVHEVTPNSVIFNLYDQFGTAMTKPDGRFTTVKQVMIVPRDMLVDRYTCVRTSKDGLQDVKFDSRAQREALRSIPMVSL